MSEPTAIHAGGPRVLILDDEPVQRMTVHLHLAGMGSFVDFGDPRAALDYLREHEVDAAVVDMRMPNLPVDGAWFLTELRKSDRDLGVVLRTADESVEVAQAAIDGRAVQRVVKATPDAKARLRAAVATAIQETRERRHALAAIKDAESTRTQLVTLLERVEYDVTFSEMCRGFVQGLTNHAATVAGCSELLLEQMAAGDGATRELLEKNRAAALALSKRITEFLSTPYLEPDAQPRINDCIAALNQVFKSHPLFGSNGPKLDAKGILPDVHISPRPARLLSALRHLIEYCAMRSRPAASITVSVSPCSSAIAALTANKHGLVLNRRCATAAPCVTIAVAAEVAGSTLEHVQTDLHTCSADPSVGNLLLVSAALLDEHLAMDVARSRRGALTFRLYVPVST